MDMKTKLLLAVLVIVTLFCGCAILRGIGDLQKQNNQAVTNVLAE